MNHCLALLYHCIVDILFLFWLLLIVPCYIQWKRVQVPYALESHTKLSHSLLKLLQLSQTFSFQEMPLPDKIYEHFLIDEKQKQPPPVAAVDSWIPFPANNRGFPVLEYPLCVGIFHQFHPTICSLWLWPVGCSSLALCSLLLAGLYFEHLQHVHLPLCSIHLLPYHIQHRVQVLRLEPYQEGRTDICSCLVNWQPREGAHHRLQPQ